MRRLGLWKGKDNGDYALIIFAKYKYLCRVSIVALQKERIRASIAIIKRQ